MGDFNVKPVSTKRESRTFTEHLINDMKALETMIEQNLFDIDTMRIGAEQELCLVNNHYRPASLSLDILKRANHPNYVTELALFNLEINCDPLEFKGNCLSTLEKDIRTHVQAIRKLAREKDAEVVLAGILPTIRKFDLSPENLTPFDRYKALLDAIGKLRGKEYELRIHGTDELNIKLDSAFIEGCNTGFQVHLQIRPDEFVDRYNVSQAIAAPVLAVAANSPFLFGKRLWKETRVALFQQSIDTRASSDHLRERSPRVTFGSDWLRGSIMEIYREDMMRFRVLLHSEIEDNSLEQLRKGKIPSLKALTTHNSTVYRWNRPCYGYQGDKPHLRIENRILPAGPTPLDEVANAAFWLGLMNGFCDHYPDLTKVMEFADAKANFLAAARNGLDTRFNWINKQKIPASELIEKELLPIAREGLQKAKVHKRDIDRYLNVIAERNQSGRSGSQWMLHSYSDLIKNSGREEAFTAITAAMVRNQENEKPVHKWAKARMEDIENWTPSRLIVEEFMSTDLFTVQKEDLLEMLAEMMEWKNFRAIPVEDDKGRLVGLVSQRQVLRYYTKDQSRNGKRKALVKDIMIAHPITIEPEASIQEAIRLLEKHHVGCLPVVKDKKLLGIITDTNFMQISSSLIKRLK